MRQVSAYRAKLMEIHGRKYKLMGVLNLRFSDERIPIFGNEYLVLGTIEKKVWQQGLSGQGQPMEEILKHAARFKHYYELEYKPAGWYPADHGP